MTGADVSIDFSLKGGPHELLNSSDRFLPKTRILDLDTNNVRKLWR